MLHYHCIILVHYLSCSPRHKRKEDDHTQTKQSFARAGDCLPWIIRPKITRITYPAAIHTIYRYIFRHITVQKKTPFLPIFIVLYLEFVVFSFFRRHISPFRRLIFAWRLSFILPLVHNQTQQNTNNMKNTLNTLQIIYALIAVYMLTRAGLEIINILNA